jgi:hypothetical protein
LTFSLPACTVAQRSEEALNDSCGAAGEIQVAATIVDSTPLRAIALVEQIEDCDDKFALLYLAEREIASRSGEEYYYNGVANPRGFYDTNPNPWEAYVLEHLEHFVSAREGAGIEVGRFHLDRIVNRSHSVIGLAEFDELRRFDDGVWEDGDGSAHSVRIIDGYEDWLTRWPGHGQVEWVTNRIAWLRARSLP